MSTTTLTLRLPAEVKDRLAVLAERTKRSSSFLAGEAIADYVERELRVVTAIERGLDDMRAGRVVPHDRVMNEIDAVLEEPDGTGR